MRGWRGAREEACVRARTRDPLPLVVKVPHVRTVDVILGRCVPGRVRLTGLPGALLVGEAHEGGLRDVGSVGTGWSDTERTTLAALLEVAGIDDCPFERAAGVNGARWVLPRMAGEARYTARTRAGLLRHPSLPPAAPRPRTGRHRLTRRAKGS